VKLKNEPAYIDSNVFIYPIIYPQEVDIRVKNAAAILKSIAIGEFSAFTSTLTWDEVVWAVRKALGKSESVNEGQKLLGFVNLQFIRADENILNQAQVLMSRYNLKPRDSIHLASAIDGKLNTIISDDQDFDAVKEIKRFPLC
jgi:uncharacterized protein